MPLTLVIGPANSAKAGEVFGAYEAAHRGALLVVPNARDAEHYGRELAAHGAVLGAVVTFGGLAGEMARRAGYSATQLTALQREQVLARALRRTDLGALGPAAEAPGFAVAAGELISELERSLITPHRFAQAMNQWQQSPTGRAAHATEIGQIYLAYARELERIARVDAELFAWRALDALRQAPGRWGADPVFFYGFDDLHPLQRDAVETLARVVGVEVMVSLTYEPGREALQARSEVVEELRPLADGVLELPALDDYYAPGSREVLHHLERHLFEAEGAPARVEPGDAVKLLESAGERAEAELVAAEVLALRRAGMKGEEIAVVHRSPDRAAPVLEHVFREYGLVLSLERRVPLAHTALGRGVLGLARCALLDERESSPQDLLDYLRTPGALEHLEVGDALELKVRCRGLTTVSAARARVDLRLGEIDALAGAADPAAELARQSRRLLAAPHRGAGAVLDGEEELDARALVAVLRALNELEALGLRLGGSELIELLAETEVSAPSARDGGEATLSDPLSIRARRFRAVIVCGLQEGEFPRTAAPEPFLSDEDRVQLAIATGLRLPQRGDALGRERYLFYSALSRATERIVLSYRSADEEGNLQLPSPFIEDVADLLVEGWIERRRRRLLGDLVWPLAEAPTPRELARATAASSLGDVANGDRWRLSSAALAHVRHSEVVSAGALEAYADCPVKWLVERELNPQALEPEAEALVRGSYMHDVLEQLLARLGQGVSRDSLPEALHILDELLTDSPPDIAPGRPEPIQRAGLEAIAADLRRYLEHEAVTDCGWQPYRLEVRFGFDDEEDSLLPLELGRSGDGATVRGAIDRVDVDPSGQRAVVRDYKSGSVRSDYQAGRWSADRKLQVPLYMLAVRELLGLEPVAGLYQPLRGRDLRARGLFLEGEAVGGELFDGDARDQEGLDAELDDAASRAVALARRLRAGDVAPCPETCTRGGCRYPGICRR